MEVDSIVLCEIGNARRLVESRPSRWRCLAALSVIVSLFAPLPSSAEPSSEPVAGSGVLTLINGNTVQGAVVPHDGGDTIRWQADAFVSPLNFRFSSVKSIKFPDREAQPLSAAPLSFELMTGDLVSGELVRWDESAVTVDAVGFGEIQLSRQSVRGLYRVASNHGEASSRLLGKQDWNAPDWSHPDWQNEGDHLWTQRSGAELKGEFDLPSTALVDLELSWSNQAEFQVDLGGKWRLIASSGRLHALHVDQSDNAGEPIELMELEQIQNIRVSIAIDRDTGQLHCFSGDGEHLGSLPESPGGGSGSAIHVRNDGESLRVERLRVARWVGKLPSDLQMTASIALKTGDLICGVLGRFDAATRSLRFTGAVDDGIPMDDVAMVLNRPLATMPAQPQCALFLRDGQRLSGDLQRIDESAWVLSGRQFDRPLAVPRTLVRSMVVFNNDAVDVSSDIPAGRPGRLEIDGHQLTGRLVPAVAELAEKAEQGDQVVTPLALRWHPFGSKNASDLAADAAGRIVYRDTPHIDNTTLAARAMEMQRQRLQQQRRGLNFGELFLRRVDSAGVSQPERDAHVVHVRTGDVIACRVEAIDQRGVLLSTVTSDDQLVPHDQIKAVELATHSPPPDVQVAKRERLLTIPRLQKTLPPTHLLCSYNGDFLRCHLIEMDAHRVLVEVQFERIELPRERIAQIIWFHPDEWASEDSSEQGVGAEQDEHNRAPSLSGLVQVLKRDGRRVTFTPHEVDAQTISGYSAIVGPCEFPLIEVDHLVFGKRIAEEVSGLAYNQWTLQPAIEPLVMQEGAGTDTPGAESSLVGTDAPDVYLELLDGREFRLSQHRGKVIVLDFWASWCAPCMLTMPKIEALMADQDPEQAMLVSVNLEESPDHIRGVMERQGFRSTVALDVDGSAAAKYQAAAIPQWVVIDPKGKIAALHVGSGDESVEKLQQVLETLAAE